MNTAAMSDRDLSRIAWGVLWSAFITFVLLLIGLPLGLFYYLNFATDSHESTLTILSGTASVDIAGRDTLAVSATTIEPEGATIRTDSNTRVQLRLFEQSRIVLLPETQLTLSALRTPKFPTISNQPAYIQLDVRRGRVRFQIPPHENIFVVVQVSTPHGQTEMQNANTWGYYSIEVDERETQISAQRGQAIMKNREGQDMLKPSERGILRTGLQPEKLPLRAKDLLADGDFELGLNDAWVTYNEQGGDGGKVDGQIKALDLEGRRAVHFRRQNSSGNHNDTGVRQNINQSVANTDRLVVKADVQILNQSLSGGGVQWSEYPLMIRIYYLDEKGGLNSFVWGAFYQNEARYKTINGEQVPQNVWYPYESPDLRKVLNPRPATITYIEIFASGHDYESMVADVSLIAE